MMTDNKWQANFLTKRVSPGGLALVSSLIFLVACFYPPSSYSYYMDEPNYMFLDYNAFLFYAMCVASFLLGVGLVKMVFPLSENEHPRLEVSCEPVSFLLVPLLIGLAFSVLSNIIVIRSNPSLLLLLMAQGGEEVKSELQLQGSLNLSNMFLIGIVWWATWRCDDLGIRGKKRVLVKTVQYLATASVILSTMLKLGRGELMPVITGIAVIYVLRKARRGEVTTGFFVKTTALFAGTVLALFLLFSYVRSSIDLTRDVMAYTIASYNRQSALLNGKLHYPYAGHGIYLFSFLGFNNMLNAIIPFREILNWPSFMDYWQSEFSAMGPAGLSPSAIWAGTFGYIFADIGWLAPAFVFFEGLLCGAAWRSIKMGRALGIILYPWIAFCILFWFGMNYLFDNKFTALCLDVVALTIYEGIFLKHKKSVPIVASS